MATVKKVVDVGPFKVTVKELTVGEIRAWLKKTAESIGQVVAEPVDLLLFSNEEVTIADLYECTDITQAIIDELGPSLLAELRRQVKDLNSHFFDMRARLAVAGQRLQTHLQQLDDQKPAEA